MSHGALRMKALITAATVAVSVLLGADAISPLSVAEAWSGAPKQVVWVALEGASKIVKVDVGRGEVLRRRRVPGPPHNLTVSPSGDTVAATLWSSGSVLLRRRSGREAVALGGSPHDVKIGGGRVVVANQSGARLDIMSPKGTRRRSIPLKANPHDVALRWRGRQAWVTLDGSDDLAVVGIRSRNVRYVSTGEGPHDLLFAPDGKLWVTDWDGAVHVFSKRGRKVGSIPLGTEAHHLAFTPNGRQAWITDHAARRVFVLGTRSLSVRKRFRVPGAPHHVTITHGGDRAVVADHDGGELIVYRTDELRQVARIPVGGNPHGVWAVP